MAIMNFSMKPKFLPMLICGLLGACATPTDNAIDLYNQQRTASLKVLGTCFADIGNTPAAKIIHAKSNPLVAKLTEEQLADKTKISNDEKKAMNELIPAVHECLRIYMNSFTGISAPYVPVYKEWMAALDKNTETLLNKKQTWGEYNKHAVEIKAAFDKNKDAVRISIDQKFAATQQMDLQRRAVATSDGYNQAPQYNYNNYTPPQSFASMPQANQPYLPPPIDNTPLNNIMKSYINTPPPPVSGPNGTSYTDTGMRGWDGRMYVPVGPNPNPPPNMGMLGQ